jgi:hypothetical protein
LISGGVELSRPHCRANDLFDLSLNDGRLASIDQVDLGTDRINADNFVTFVRQTPRRNRTNITEPEYTNPHSAFLSATA